MKRFAQCVMLTAMVAAISCSKKEENKKIAPASIENPVNEVDLTTIKLTEAAVKRLGIRSQAIQEKNITRMRLHSGEVSAVQGQSMTMTAPVSGTILALRNSTFPSAGSQVSKGQILYRLLILPSEKDLISAHEDVKLRKVQYDVAVEKLRRAEQLLKDKAGSLRAKQDAEAELANITAGLRVAEARVELMKGNSGAEVSDKLPTLNVESAVSGFVQKVYVSPSQVISANAPIMDISSVSPLWVRVPVYAGDLNLIDNKAIAYVRGLSDFNSSSVGTKAMKINGPQTADPLSSSADVFYEMNNSAGLFRPGQRVSVTLPLKSELSSLVIPFSAVVYDINGGTWVYQAASANSFIRHRVEVANVENAIAIIRRGPPAGTMIVTEGVAELFGTEFGGAK